MAILYIYGYIYLSIYTHTWLPMSIHLYIPMSIYSFIYKSFIYKTTFANTFISFIQTSICTFKSKFLFGHFLN